MGSETNSVVHAADIVARRVGSRYQVVKNRYGSPGDYSLTRFAWLRMRHLKARVVVL
jgi:hypothetical protein